MPALLHIHSRRLCPILAPDSACTTLGGVVHRPDHPCGGTNGLTRHPTKPCFSPGVIPSGCLSYLYYSSYSWNGAGCQFELNVKPNLQRRLHSSNKEQEVRGHEPPLQHIFHVARSNAHSTTPPRLASSPCLALLRTQVELFCNGAVVPPIEQDKLLQQATKGIGV